MSSAQRLWQSLAILKSRIPWLIAYFLGACLLLSLLNIYADRIDSLFGSAKELREEVQHAIVLVLVFYIFYHTATTISFVNHIKDAVVDLLAANKSMFENLSTEVRERYVANSIESTLGDEFGTAIVTDIVRPYLLDQIPSRKKFEYDIEALENVPTFENLKSPKCLALVEKLVPPKGYLWLNQICKYVPHDAKSRLPIKGPYVLAVAFDKIELQRLLPQHTIFFREIIEMEKELKDIAFQFSDEDANEFVREVMRLSISELAGGHLPIEYSVTAVNRASRQLYIQITTIASKTGDASGAAISFNLPQSREAPWFVTSLPQPCENPIISFRRNSQMTQLEPVLFLSNFQEKKIDLEPYPPGSDDPVKFKVTVDGWTFPTNGVMFTWRYRGSAPKVGN